MGEYGREQKNRLSRMTTNSEPRSGQLKGFIDNRRSTNRIIQYKPRMLECRTEITIFDGRQRSKVARTGRNNSFDKKDVLNTIRAHKETAWIADISKQSGGNEPGSCAEPHSLANTLNAIRQDDKIEDVVQSSTKFVLTPDGNAKKNGYKIGDIYPPCETCKKWVPDLYKISESWSDYADVAD